MSDSIYADSSGVQANKNNQTIRDIHFNIRHTFNHLFTLDIYSIFVKEYDWYTQNIYFKVQLAFDPPSVILEAKTMAKTVSYFIVLVKKVCNYNGLCRLTV